MSLEDNSWNRKVDDKSDLDNDFVSQALDLLQSSHASGSPSSGSSDSLPAVSITNKHEGLLPRVSGAGSPDERPGEAPGHTYACVDQALPKPIKDPIHFCVAPIKDPIYGCTVPIEPHPNPIKDPIYGCTVPIEPHPKPIKDPIYGCTVPIEPHPKPIKDPIYGCTVPIEPHPKPIKDPIYKCTVPIDPCPKPVKPIYHCTVPIERPKPYPNEYMCVHKSDDWA